MNEIRSKGQVGIVRKFGILKIGGCITGVTSHEIKEIKVGLAIFLLVGGHLMIPLYLSA